MSKPNTARRNSSFVSIRKRSLKNLLPYANGQEKDETPAVSIEGLKAIGRIVRAIKDRIEAGQGAGKPAGGNLPGPAATGPNSSQNTHPEGR